MPEQKSNVCVTFDRDIIRTKITKLSYKEARRLKGPIYHVLLKELLEEGCPNTYNYVECLLAKENNLINLNYTSDRLRNEPEYFIAIVENLKLAELSLKLGNGGGWLAALKILYQTMTLAQSRQQKFNWFVTDIFEIVINIMKQLDEENPCYNELRMRIFYRYAIYVNSRGLHFQHAIDYFHMAFELAKGEKWRPDDPIEQAKYETVYEAIPPKLAQVLLLKGRKVLNKSPEAALALATQAVRTLSATSWIQNKYLACVASLTKGLFMIECKKYEMALLHLAKLQPLIIRDHRSEFFRLQCETYLCQGQCHYNLNYLVEALNAYRTGYILSRKYNIRDIQAEFLLSIGRAYGKIESKLKVAIDAYIAARNIFALHGDTKNKMKTTYLLAKLKADQLFPQFLNLIKSHRYCDFYKLRQWKNQCKPFWKQVHEKPAIQQSQIISGIHLSSVESRTLMKSLMKDENIAHVNSNEDFERDIEFIFEDLDKECEELKRRSTDFFGEKEILRLKSTDWAQTAVGRKMKLLGDRKDLDCLLQEFENVEEKL